MKHKIIAILSDLDNLSLHKVPIELYNEIRAYLNNEPYANFQKLYDDMCKRDKEKQDPKMRQYFELIEQCETEEVDLIQTY